MGRHPYNRTAAMKSRLYILVICLLFTAAVAAATSPRERVEAAVDSVVAILQDTTLDRQGRWARIAGVIGEGFDFPSMSQSVLATHWQRATPAEQQRFTDFFAQYIEQVYRNKIEAYSGQEIRYGEERIRGDRAVVETTIITDSAEIPVNFRLRHNDGQWYAYDVVIEGVSLVSNYRSTFSAIVKRDGMDGLLADIQQRLDRLEAGAATPGG